MQFVATVPAATTSFQLVPSSAVLNYTAPLVTAINDPLDGTPLALVNVNGLGSSTGGPHVMSVFTLIPHV